MRAAPKMLWELPGLNASDRRIGLQGRAYGLTTVPPPLKDSANFIIKLTAIINIHQQSLMSPIKAPTKAKKPQTQETLNPENATLQ